jgi:hypothetical protein
MELSLIMRQALVFGHIVFFAMALGAIITEDLRLLSNRLDTDALHSTARAIKWLLAALWVTGVPMVMMDVGTDVVLLISKPKLLTKICVVCLLTANGVLLHSVVFPMLKTPRSPRLTATLASLLGAISTASWLYASFVGAARYVGPHLTLRDFVALYALALLGAVMIALLFVRRRLARMLSGQHAMRTPGTPEPRLAPVFEDVEGAIAMLSRLHERLLADQPTARLAPAVAESRYKTQYRVRQSAA